MQKLISVFFLVITMFCFSCKKKVEQKIEQKGPVLSKGWASYNVTTETLSDISFVNQSRGFASTGSSVYTTIDSGRNWIRINTVSGNNFYNIDASGWHLFVVHYRNSNLYRINSSSNVVDTLRFGEALFDISFINNNIGYCIGERSLFKTVNNGATWQNVYQFRKSTFEYKTLFFRSEKVGWLANTRDTLHVSQNSDQSYSTTSAPVKVYEWYGISAPSDATVYFATNAGLLKSIDGGKSLLKMNLPIAVSGFFDIEFIDEANGYCCIKNFIYKTTDGGVSWQAVVELDSNEGVVELDFVNANFGSACTTKGRVLIYKN